MRTLCTEQRSWGSLEVICQGPSNGVNTSKANATLENKASEQRGVTPSHVRNKSFSGIVKLDLRVWSFKSKRRNQGPRNEGLVRPRVLQVTKKGMFKPKWRRNNYAEQWSRQNVPSPPFRASSPNSKFTFGITKLLLNASK